MTNINKHAAVYGIAAIATLSVMAFVVIPQLPQINSDLNKVSTAANSAFAIADGYGDGGCCGGGDYGGGGYDGGGGGGTPDPVPQVYPAVCNYLNVSDTVPYGGGTVDISWSVSNATSITITKNGESIGRIGTSQGSSSHYVSGDTTFVLTAVGAGGNSSCSDTVTMTPPPPPPSTPVDCIAFTANGSTSTTVPYGGGNVTLAWNSQGSWAFDNGVVLSSGGSIIKSGLAASGSHTVFVDSNKTFDLTVAGNGGSDNCQASVTVEPPVVQNAAKCESFTVNGAKTATVPANGANVTLAWDTTNATAVSIDNGVGNVSADGSKNVFVNSNITFKLTAVGAGGNADCTVSVTKETSVDAPRCDYFRVSDDEVEEGDDVTLSWETTNATTVSINHGIGTVSSDGSRTVEINDDITYVLTVSNASGSNNCEVDIEIEKEEKKKSPRCELDISKDRVNKGEKVTLSWETTNVDEIVIKDNRGNTIFDTDDYSKSQRKKYFDGEIDVIINQSTEFRMTAYGEDGGSKTCKVDVETDDIAIYEKRDQALVIALTQVPYTGFEAGAFLTFLFYAVLTLWALFIAYVLVIKKGSILGFSLYGNQNGMTASDAENRKKVEALVAKYADRSWK